MNNFFEKLDNKMDDNKLIQAVHTEQTAEYYRLAENAVRVCKQVLQEYETQFKQRGFSVYSRFNTHYFEFRVNDIKHKQFPSLKIAIANNHNRPEFYLIVANQTISTGQPTIDKNFSEPAFRTWLNQKLESHLTI